MSRETQADLLERIERVANAPRLYCVRRPIHIYERVEGKAKLVEERAHLDVLIDRIDGTRSVLQRLDDPEKVARWHELAEHPDTRRLDVPLTCTRAALPVVLDWESKHIHVGGGNQSGKSHIGAHWLFDRILARRGLYLWLAPTLEKTQVGVERLTRDTDFAAAVIPPELILSAPATARSGDQAIRLIDGTVVSLRYCSRRGGNLKGLTGVRACVLDEGTEVQHEMNFDISTNRLLMAGGQMLIPTTPVAGHWLQAKNQEAVSYEQIEHIVERG